MGLVAHPSPYSFYSYLNSRTLISLPQICHYIPLLILEIVSSFFPLLISQVVHQMSRSIMSAPSIQLNINKLRQNILLKYRSQVRGGALIVLIIEAKDNVDGRCALNLLLQFLPCYSSTLNNKRTKKQPSHLPYLPPALLDFHLHHSLSIHTRDHLIR